MRASLCNDATYYAVMTEQCPRTCGRCSGSTGTTGSACADKLNPATGVSDCPALSHLCNNAAYTTLMTEQCPRTCNRCSGSGVSTATTVSGSCVDKVNPRTGTSDCSMRASLCPDSNYIALMRTECPRTCRFCSSTGVSGASTVAGTATVPGATVTTRAAGTCVDALNPRTGVSDCPQRVSLCNDSVYRDLMQTQCPKTCGVC
ncbi:shTK domain protein [Ancylostoma caninum]|uniref:ShTK domain protein n=1 Tax=Ancylostoma caninum TaxID=29170 RepID=A0A368FIX1_ANCCA|nr:shTK domain protein [Ancylostoma caninum]